MNLAKEMVVSLTPPIYNKNGEVNNPDYRVT